MRRGNSVQFDREFLLALHDWNGQFQPGDEMGMQVVYEHSTINGRTEGFGEPPPRAIRRARPPAHPELQPNRCALARAGRA